MHSIFLTHYFKDYIIVSARVELAVMYYTENWKDLFFVLLDKGYKSALINNVIREAS